MTTQTAPETSTPTATLRWQPEHGQQTAALRVAGLKVQDLRDAGFVWAKSQAWEAPVSASALYRQDRKATEFRAWLDELGAEITDNGQAFEKAFKRTGVQTSLVVINK